MNFLISFSDLLTRTYRKSLDLFKHYKIYVLAFFALISITISSLPIIQNLRFIQTFEYNFLDFRYQARGPLPPNPDIVIIGIGDSSLNILDLVSKEDLQNSEALSMMKNNWPWNRKVFGLALEKLLNADARLVVFDLAFNTKNSGDDFFSNILKSDPDKTVLCSYIDYQSTKSYQNNVVHILPYDDLISDEVNESEWIGYSTIWPDGDGTIRRVVHGKSLIAEQLSGMAEKNPELAATLPDLDEMPPDIFSLAFTAAKRLKVQVKLPPAYQSNLINFSGPGNTYDIIPFENLFLTGQWDTQLENGKIFKDKIVIIGPTSEIGFKDVHDTPFGPIAGPEVHANIIATLLSEKGSIDESLFQGNLLANFLVTLCVLFVSIYFRNAFVKLFFILAVAIGWFLVGQYLFNVHHIYVSNIGPITGICLLGGLAFTFDFLIEQFERNRFHDWLHSFVSPNVANHLIKNPKAYDQLVQGKRKTVAILFSDIRKFTTWCEKWKNRPGQLFSNLNEYYEEMVNPVIQTEGTLHQYVGDEIMVVWGDTMDEDKTKGLWTPKDCANRAVESAKMMQINLKELNKRWTENSADKLTLEAGIGISLGEVSIGFRGHSKRQEFAAMGDEVNLTSRVEGLTKFYKQTLLVTESIYNLTRDTTEYRFVDQVIVKGRSKPITVYTIANTSSSSAILANAHYKEGFELYKNKSFDEAIEKFNSAKSLYGDDDYLCKMFVDRCQQYLKNAPPSYWDGSYVMLEK